MVICLQRDADLHMTQLRQEMMGFWDGSGIIWTVQTVCTSLQTDNHTSTTSLDFCRPDCQSTEDNDNEYIFLTYLNHVPNNAKFKYNINGTLKTSIRTKEKAVPCIFVTQFCQTFHLYPLHISAVLFVLYNSCMLAKVRSNLLQAFFRCSHLSYYKELHVQLTNITRLLPEQT